MATSTLGSGTLVLAGTTSGTTTVTATAVAGTTTLTLPAATDTLVGKATTDTLTNKTLTGAAMNGTLGATTASTANVTTLTTSSTITHNGGTVNGVPYLNGSKVLTTGSALVFDGTNLGVGYSTINTTIAVNGNALFGTGAWPINDFGRSGSRFVNASSTEDGYLVVLNMQSGVGASRGGYIYLGARATTGVDGATFATVNGIRENATSGNYSTALTFNTSTSAGTLTERARFNSTGALVFNGGTTTADGIGITFPATQSASSNANTLDDYEEGTWTPSIGGNATYTTQVGFYTKIGRQVTLIFNLEILLLGTGSTTTITGAPFAPAANMGNYHTGSVFWEAIASSQISVGIFIQQSTSDIYFYTRSTAGTSVVNASAIIGSGTILRGTLTYFV